MIMFVAGVRCIESNQEHGNQQGGVGCGTQPHTARNGCYRYSQSRCWGSLPRSCLLRRYHCPRHPRRRRHCKYFWIQSYHLLESTISYLAAVQCREMISPQARNFLSHDHQLYTDHTRGRWSWLLQAGGETYAVPTGRRDSRVSLASSVNLPGPGFSVASAAAAFRGRGLDITDMVTLLGAHTVGGAHCEFFYNRLYNFNGTDGLQDPSMAESLAASLKAACPMKSVTSRYLVDKTTVAMDQGTEFVFDKSYYHQLQHNHGVLQIDQELTHDPTTSPIVKSLAQGSATHFSSSFGNAIVKMGNIGVLTGSQGEIRRICSKIN